LKTQAQTIRRGFGDALAGAAAFPDSQFDGLQWQRTDSIVLLSILLFVIYKALAIINWHGLPAEDALMLMRYANHFAAGHGITWNIGDHPVEGATDFLYLVALTVFIKISHLGAIFSARILLTLCHLGTVAFLYYSARKIFAVHPAFAAALALYLGTGPGLVHSSNGFSGPFYGLMASVAWYFALTTVTSGSTLRRSIGFASFALLTGLTRPDGVLLAIFMTAALLYALRGSAKQIILITVGIFLVFGGAYFLWRWHYFGHLLPNPFYKKGGGHLYPFSLKRSLTNVTKMILPMVPVYIFGLIAPRARRRTIFALIPIVGFAVIWVLLTNENNLGMRFQYVVLPISLMSMPLVIKGLIEEIKARGWSSPAVLDRRALNTAAIVAVLCTIGLASIWWSELYYADMVPPGSGAYKIATGMAQWQDKSYTVLATEAGVIPYFSNWRAIDGWGLNDAEIVHNPLGLTDAYIDQNSPAIIMFYLQPPGSMEEFNKIWRGDPPSRQDITQLLNVMSHYAVTHNYELAARWGASACYVNVWYVKRGLPESQQMIDLIRTTPYYDPYVGRQLDVNYLDNKTVYCEDTDVRINSNQ
jgi:arabinofuranosyltransferase